MGKKKSFEKQRNLKLNFKDISGMDCLLEEGNKNR